MQINTPQGSPTTPFFAKKWELLQKANERGLCEAKIKKALTIYTPKNASIVESHNISNTVSYLADLHF
ncbi:hypothetical protein AGMMS49936_04120 [Endomicrobiia bacterium]|nr:hypothetical protein AGMMS49936_04120 [Endomicrobiia bacterium]